MDIRPLAIVPALLLAAGLATAADGPALNDLRLEGGISPSNYKLANEDNRTNDSIRFGVQYLRSFQDLGEDGSWFLGLEASDTTANGKDNAGDVNTIVGDLHLGYAFALPNNWRNLDIELGIFGGAGRSTFKRDADGSTFSQKVDSSDFYWEAGARGALVYTFQSRFQIGADIRYVHGEFKPDTGDTTEKLKDDGLIAMLLLGYRF